MLAVDVFILLGTQFWTSCFISNSNDIITLVFWFWEIGFYCNCSFFFRNLSFLFDCFQDQELYALVFCSLIAVFLDWIYFYFFCLECTVLTRMMYSFMEKFGFHLSNSGNFRPLSFWIYLSSVLSILPGFQLNKVYTFSLYLLSLLLACIFHLISAVLFIKSLDGLSTSLHVCLFKPSLVFNFNSYIFYF